MLQIVLLLLQPNKPSGYKIICWDCLKPLQRIYVYILILCVGGIMVGVFWWEIGKQSLNSSQVCFIHFHVNTFGKGMNLTLLHKTPFLVWILVKIMYGRSSQVLPGADHFVSIFSDGLHAYEIWDELKT